ncbi:MAG: hypothetical protein R3B54_17915 [Bdellovibrionota bacterium]
MIRGLTLLVVYGAAMLIPFSSRAADPKLRFYYASNRQGEVEPCGCQTG